METSIVGVGVGITDRFRSVVEDKAARIEHLAPRAQRVDIKVTHRAYHNGRVEDDTVELTLTGKGPLVRAEATDGDKFAALDLAVDKLCEQLRRAKDKRIDARQHPRGAKFEKGTGAIQGIDLQPASVDVLRAVEGAELAALIRQESMFTPTATSGAGARGLMQVMPEVGRAVARALKFPVWDPVLLYQPDVNVQLGMAHLGELDERYPAAPAKVLAAYNAGASRVERWSDKRGVADPEMFIERIPYVETRGYVRIIGRNLDFYRALYDWTSRPAS